mgnify:CR=1 FL=1
MIINMLIMDSIVKNVNHAFANDGRAVVFWTPLTSLKTYAKTKLIVVNCVLKL